jgi:hypothetical protein
MKATIVLSVIIAILVGVVYFSQYLHKLQSTYEQYHSIKYRLHHPIFDLQTEDELTLNTKDKHEWDVYPWYNRRWETVYSKHHNYPYY